MKFSKPLFTPLLCAAVLGILLPALVSRATAQKVSDPVPPQIEIPEVDTSDPLAPLVQLPVASPQATDFALEVSDDLRNWVTLRNYHVQSSERVIVPASTPTEDGNTCRFYRLNLPGQLVDAQLAQWKSRGIVSYQFHYAPRIGFCNCINSATVTVRNGVVTSVTDAIRASGASEPDPNLAEFPTMETLFAQIKTAQQNPELVWVGAQYDANLGYPTEMALWANPDSSHGFVISDFQVLP